MLRWPLLTASALILASSSIASAQPYRLGWREFTPTDRVADNIASAQVDGVGNFSVAGVSPGAGNQPDVLIRKLDPMGKELWRTTFDAGQGTQTDFVRNLLVTPQGNAVLTLDYPFKGYGKFVAAQVNGQTGKLEWSRFYDTGNGRAQAWASAIDASGNLIQAGGFGSNARAEIAVVQWTPAGEPKWIQRWVNQPQGDREALALAIGRSGDITLAGYATVTGAGRDSFVARYSSAGALIWAQTFPGAPGFGNDRVTAITVDANGDAVVAGDEYIEGSTTTLYIAKLASSSGQIVWKTPIREVRNSQGEAVGIHRVADGYLVGGSLSELTPQGRDFAVLKIGLDGKVLWKTLIHSGGNNADQATAMTVDSQGFAYLAGSAELNRKEKKYFVAAVNPTGQVAWTHLEAEGNAFGEPSQLTLHEGTGHLMIAGNRPQGVLTDPHLLCLYLAPRAVARSFTVVQGETLQVETNQGLRSQSLFAQFASVVVSKVSGEGELSLQTDGSFSFKAPANFEGQSEFRYVLSREGLTSSTGSLRFTVTKKPG
ncbi:MAG TPA: hypothetical protein PLO61_04500 [Fimbriimonadaceae bacterium]|nr:hypothetical protein [Fimbriimonadaceae bacterium]HRJ32780.1 hypothetical protein [Fimbriimonadaceae bacterium]